MQLKKFMLTALYTPFLIILVNKTVWCIVPLGCKKCGKYSKNYFFWKSIQQKNIYFTSMAFKNVFIFLFYKNISCQQCVLCKVCLPAGPRWTMITYLYAAGPQSVWPWRTDWGDLVNWQNGFICSELCVIIFL